MPIKDKTLYPKNWEKIRAEILKRAKNKCETCGAQNYKPHPITGSKVILTIMHLNHNPRDNRRKNLKAGCQRCHLIYDAPLHALHSRETRIKKLRLQSLF